MPAASAAVAASDAWADCGTAHLEAAEVLEALATWRSANCEDPMIFVPGVIT